MVKPCSADDNSCGAFVGFKDPTKEAFEIQSSTARFYPKGYTASVGGVGCRQH